MVLCDLFEPVWTNLVGGQLVSVVVKDVIWHASALTGVTVPGEQRIRVSGTFHSEVVGFPRLTVLRATFVRLSGLVDLTLDSSASLLPHRPVIHEDVLNYVELCAGMGASSFGFSKVGFHPRCAVEWQAALVDLHRRVHPEVPVLHADICHEDTAAKVFEVWPEPTTLMAGISCQPYSRGGLGHGGEDERAATLPATLKIMHWLQAPVLVIECVTQAQHNSFVTSHVSALESQLGYSITQCRFRLENVWAACRYRWWLVACHPSLGSVSIPAQPSGSSLCVRDLMPFVLRWPSEVEHQLQLTDLELEKFQSNGRHLRQFLVQPDQKLPTALHSWGGQVLSCACGCREGGFSDSLLDSKGLYAQIVHFTNDDGVVIYRHLHAIEVALLCGVPPCLNWSDNERLNLCAVGQLATPMQSVWIGASIVRHLQKTFTEGELLDPLQALHDMKQMVFAQGKSFFTTVPKALPDPSPKHAQVIEVILSQDVKLLVKCGPKATVRDLVWAECDLRHVPVFDIVACTPECLDPLPMDFALHQVPRIVLRDANQVLAPAPAVDVVAPCFAADDLVDGPAPTQVDGDVTDAHTTDGDTTMHDVGFGLDHPSNSDHTVAALLQLNYQQLLEMLPPLVGDPNLLSALCRQTIDSDVRKTLLALQCHVWGDDEIRWHLSQTLLAACTHDTLLLDPLLASSWVRIGNVDWIKSWLPADGLGNRIISAVLFEGHWTPFVWVKKVSYLEVMCWEHDDVDMHHFYPLHGLLCQALDLPMFRVACTRRNFGRDMCGAASVLFARSVFLHGNLPFGEAGLIEANQAMKVDFQQYVGSMEYPVKPWCWGAGVPDVQTVLSNLLQFHGVPQAVSPQRAKLVLQSLGREQVQAAVSGVSPWKSLKQLANQHTPIVQLVLPDELASVMIAKKTKGDHKHPKKGGPRHAPLKPAEVDPSRLQLTEASFCLPDGTPVGQIPLCQVGPLATGVALVNFCDAQQFVQAGKVLTSKGLAILAINGPSECHTDLNWSTVRFAATCAANNQPVLLAGLLIQLGQTQVGPYQAMSGPVVPSFPVACARVSVFKDQWPGDWESFGEHPVRSILEALPPLQACRTESCNCNKWHPEAGDAPSDVVLDVFRRQFFTDAGRPVKASQGSHFSVQLRYLKTQEHGLLKLSGNAGVFIEPRSMDATSPSDEYQVVWIPQASCPEVIHQAQCETLSVGVARSGRRFGIRVPAQHFQSVFSRVKPEGQFLAPGQRMTWHCGPWPYGSDRKTLGKVFSSWSWQARPLQPAKSVEGGVMWLVQSVTEPPQAVWNMQHGQVMISRCESLSAGLAQVPNVIGPQSTVELCSGAQSDPWLLKDPWTQAVRSVPLQAAPNVSAQLQELEERVEQAILQKLPSERMETDETENRLQALEQQMQHLASRHQSLEGMVSEQHKQHTAQMQGLQNQVVTQMEAQRTQVETLFESQMSRLEAILAKKGRYE